MDDGCIAVITARGGSKRIPKKNIRDFCGKPILAYSIEAALKSKIFDEVMVSTDDEMIKKIALQYGAKVPFMRSEETSNDMAATHEVLLEVLEEYKKVGREFQSICCIYPTAPFVTSERLIQGMQKLVNEDAKTVLPVVRFSFPPQRGLVEMNGKMEFQNPENAFMRSQDLQAVYHDAGQFYCLKVDEFLKSKKIIMDNTRAIVLDEMEVQDIDNEMDWKLAELKYQLLNTRHYEGEK